MTVEIKDTLEILHPADVGKMVFTTSRGSRIPKPSSVLLSIENHFGKIGHNSTSNGYDLNEEECAALRNYLNRQLKAYDHRAKK